MTPRLDPKVKENYFGVRPWKRHGLVLMVAGFAYMAVGMSYIFTKTNTERSDALVLPLHWFPIGFWGFVFIFSGLMSIISSRWPPVAETWGYMVLTGLSAGWSATYGLGVLLFKSPATNYNGAIIWGLMAFLWWAISGLLNPDKEAVSTYGCRSDS